MDGDLDGWRTAAPIVVAGMHRSGTSLVASVLSMLGVSLGSTLLGADRNNPKGYFEDTDFLRLNREMLAAATIAGEPGHQDWGWTESEALDRAAFEAFRGRATALSVQRLREERPATKRWGWKDPRTSLMLDFWNSVFPDARYVLLYRHPWDVADSMQRLGADVFLRRPDYAWRIWAFYNRQLLDFHQRNRGRTLLVCSEAVRREPEKLAALFESALGLDAGRFRSGAAALIDPALHRSVEPHDPLISLACAAHPESAALLAALDEAADIPGHDTWFAHPLRAPVSSGPPAISVIIPCYDQGEYLLDAVASVERSIEQPYELIIVNDGSREARTKHVLGLLRDAGYTIVDQANEGLSSARNRGLELSASPFVIPLDSDNRLRAGFVTAAVRILDSRPDVAVVYGDRQDFGLRNDAVDVPEFDLDHLLVFNFIDACAVVRKKALVSCGGYDARMSPWEDWGVWVALAARGWAFTHLPGLAFDYRVRPGSMISAIDDHEVRARLYRHVIAQHAALYTERLPEVLIASQHSADALFRYARDYERLEAEARSTTIAHAAALDRALAERQVLQRELRDARRQLELVGRTDGIDRRPARTNGVQRNPSSFKRTAALESTGTAVLDFLKGRGLRPSMRLLDIARGFLRHGVPLAQYLNVGNYFGIDVSRSAPSPEWGIEVERAGLRDKVPFCNLLHDASLHAGRFGTRFDFVLALSVFTQLDPASLRRCLHELSSCLRRTGKFYVTYVPNSNESDAGGFSELIACGSGLPYKVETLGPWAGAGDEHVAVYALQ